MAKLADQSPMEDDAASCASSSHDSVSGVESSDEKLGDTSKMTTTQDKSSESSTLARAETIAVNRTKMLVLLVLSVAAIGVGLATYFVSRNVETLEFESQVRCCHFAVDITVATLSL